MIIVYIGSCVKAFPLHNIKHYEFDIVEEG